MQSIVRESFSDARLAVACAVLGQQWKAGRIASSSPENPGDADVAFVMHGLVEITMFAVREFPKDQVEDLTQKTLPRFEESNEVRQALMDICMDSLIPVLSYVVQ